MPDALIGRSARELSVGFRSEDLLAVEVPVAPMSRPIDLVTAGAGA